MVVRDALRRAPFSMRQLAQDAGLGYDTLRAWSAGQKNPARESIAKLARGLRKRAERLLALAEKLEREAER